MPTKDAHGHVQRDYEFGTFSTKYPDGLGGTGDGVGLIIDLSGRQTDEAVHEPVGRCPPGGRHRPAPDRREGQADAGFTSEVTDGLGYVQAQAEAKLVAGDKVQLETRLLDQAGKPVSASLTERYVVALTNEGKHSVISLQADSTKPR